jgi:hypothetical protein
MMPSAPHTGVQHRTEPARGGDEHPSARNGSADARHPGPSLDHD